VTAAILGLNATLSDPACRRVVLRAADGAPDAVFVRQGADAWLPDGRRGTAVRASDLSARIEGGLGGVWLRVECGLTDHDVVYEVQRGAVRVRRRPRATPAEGSGDESGPLMDALGIPGSKRKAKFRQACQFGKIVMDALPAGRGTTLRLLDLACGRSYLGFFLVDRLKAQGHSVVLHGVDAEADLVERCRRIAADAGWDGCTFEVGDLAAWSAPVGGHDVVLALHACDTLTDDAIGIAWSARAPLLFAAPCCQHELRHLWADHPLRWVARYGLLEQRAADALTDGLRCLVLEALGYRVKVLRFTDADVSAKNLLIQAELTGRPQARCAEAALDFVRRFHARPKIVRLLEDAGPETGRPRSG
jgi:hypothetical protein